MKSLFLAITLSALCIEIQAQCASNVCENLPVTIDADVSPPPAGESYSYNWSLPIAFNGQGSDVIQIVNIGPAPATIPYTITVTNDVTGCVSVYTCDLIVGASVPVSLNIPPYCPNSPPFDISSYVNPPNSTLSGPGVIGVLYDPAIGGPVTATPPPGSGCLVASSQTPGLNPVPNIIGATVTQ